MDPKSEAHKQELVRQLEIQRGQLNITHDKLMQTLSVSHQFQQSISRHPARWAAGSATTAALALLVLRKPRDRQGRPKRRSATRWFLGSTFALARPFVAKWLMEQARHRITPELLERVRKS